MKKQSKLMTFLMSLLLAFMLAVPGNAVSTQAAGQGDMAVHFIDVGQGLAILVIVEGLPLTEFIVIEKPFRDF